MEHSFFLPGDDCEPTYRNIRDLEHCLDYREFTEYLWARYQPSHDRHFQKDARRNFQQRFWEMYLYAALQDLGLNPEKGETKGPDFFIMLDDRRYCVEAVAPRAGSGPDQVPPIVFGEVRLSPLDEIQLRYSNAMTEKIKKWSSWLEAGLAFPNDGYILAINGRSCNDFHDGYPPLFIRASLGIGNPALSINPTNGKIKDTFYTFKDAIQKKSGEHVSTTLLLDKANSAVSGVIHSLAYCAYRPIKLFEGFEYLHNPCAALPFPDCALQKIRRYNFADSQLFKHEPNPPWPSTVIEITQ